MALEGVSCRQIAVQLNEANIPPPSVYAGLKQARQGVYAGLWSANVFPICCKTRPTSEIWFQGTERKNQLQEQEVSASGAQGLDRCRKTHEPLVSRETFDKGTDAGGQPEEHPLPHLRFSAKGVDLLPRMRLSPGRAESQERQG